MEIMKINYCFTFCGYLFDKECFEWCFRLWNCIYG